MAPMSNRDSRSSLSADADPPVRLAIVDDHEMVAAGLAALVSDEPDIEVVGIATTIAAAEELVNNTHPNVVVIDHQLPDGGGPDGTRRLLALDPSINVVMLTASADEHALADALSAGCCGFINKAGPIETLIHAVRAAAKGDAAFPADVVAQLAQLRNQPLPAVGSDLSTRELEVLRALGGGLGTAAMAEMFGLSEHTVRNHVSNILVKLGAHTKLQAVVIAARLGLIDVLA
jgi:DNA-binding NarL/FixJ family response regulator